MSDAKGLGIVDERRAETAVWVARYWRTSRENLAMLLVPQTAAATWRVLRASVSLIFSLCYFPFRSFVLLCLPVAVFLFFFRFCSSLFFSSVRHIACGGGHGSLFLLYIFMFSLSICLLCFCFFIVSFRFSISWKNVYIVPVVSSTTIWHCIAHCRAYCIRGNVVSLLRRSFVIT